jgi:hypothetical protein
MAQLRDFLQDGTGTTHQPCAVHGEQGTDLRKNHRKERIAEIRLRRGRGLRYPDGVFASDCDIVSDTSKARRFGFDDPVDTEEMSLRMFSDFRRERIIP